MILCKIKTACIFTTLRSASQVSRRISPSPGTWCPPRTARSPSDRGVRVVPVRHGHARGLHRRLAIVRTIARTGIKVSEVLIMDVFLPTRALVVHQVLQAVPAFGMGGASARVFLGVSLPPRALVVHRVLQTVPVFVYGGA